MTNPADNEWFVKTYDAFVASEGDTGADLEKSRDEVAHSYATAVENGDVKRHQDDLVAEGRKLFDRWVGRVRSARRDSFKRDVLYLIDAASDETILGPNDPVFATPYPLGDGRDKVLGLWTVEDWLGAVHERNSNAVAVAAAAHEFSICANVIVERLKSTNSRITSQLFKTATTA